MSRTAWTTLFLGALSLASVAVVQAGPPPSHPPHPVHPAHPQHVNAPKPPHTGSPHTPHGSGPHDGGTVGHGHSGTVPPGQAKHGTAGNQTGTSALPHNPKLAAKLQPLLPAGMTMEQAAGGFRNQGQFIAALHVSQNLGIPFADLKMKMVADGMSLGQSIQSLRPSADADVEAERAMTEARRDLDDDHDLSPR